MPMYYKLFACGVDFLLIDLKTFLCINRQLFDLKYSKNNKMFLQITINVFYVNKYKNYSCDGKAVITPVFGVT